MGSQGSKPLSLPLGDKDREAALQEWLKELQEDGSWDLGRIGIFSAHQMGTAKMSTSYLEGIYNPQSTDLE
tara:strand:- start:1004 stop:1216 length:213 start_codon:yes stop_codon:yes gene_type:complete